MRATFPATRWLVGEYLGSVTTTAVNTTSNISARHTNDVALMTCASHALEYGTVKLRIIALSGDLMNEPRGELFRAE